jgi:hypothetical protein
LVVVGQRLPIGVGDRRDRGLDVLLLAHSDRVGPARGLKAGHDLLVPETGVGAQQLRAGRAGARNAGNELLDEPQRAPCGVRRALAGADVQHLAGLSARGEDRVVATLAGIAKRSALLVIAVDLTDERIDVDRQTLLARSRAGCPCPPKALREHPIELTDMPEGERAQERPQRRRRADAVPEHRRGLSRAQHVAVLDAVRPEATGLSIVIALRPGLAAPGRSPRSTRASTSRSIPSRPASITPAFATARSSSNTTTADSFTITVTS